MPGKLVILSGPSGAGKSTLAKYLLENESYGLVFSVSATSREKRENEEHGKDYYFLSLDSFKGKIEDGEFLEWEEVYPNQYYGTLKLHAEALRTSGNNLIFDVDVMGGLNIKQKYKEDAISIFVQPPSTEVLEQRLRERKTESDESIKKRLKKSKMEMVYARRYDHIIVNDNLDNAKKEVDELVSKFLNS